MTNEQAIAYIDSIMSNYEARVIYRRKDDPKIRLCEVWLSDKDMIALKMAIEALKHEQLIV